MMVNDLSLGSINLNQSIPCVSLVHPFLFVRVRIWGQYIV